MKKFDYLIIVMILSLSFLLFLPSFFPKAQLTAVISQNGEIIHTVNLSSADKEYIIETGGCKIKIEQGAVSFVASTCPDKLCVKCGKLTQPGQTMACVPNKVVVAITSNTQPYDAVAS